MIKKLFFALVLSVLPFKALMASNVDYNEEFQNLCARNNWVAPAGERFNCIFGDTFSSHGNSFAGLNICAQRIEGSGELAASMIWAREENGLNFQGSIRTNMLVVGHQLIIGTYKDAQGKVHFKNG